MNKKLSQINIKIYTITRNNFQLSYHNPKFFVFHNIKARAAAAPVNMQLTAPAHESQHNALFLKQNLVEADDVFSWTIL